MSRILLGVGAGIAAFKAAALCSQLVQQGHRVRVAMTPRALEFIGARSFEGLCGSQVILQATQVDADGSVPHIQASRDIDLMVILPATAGLIARLAAGSCDDAVCLAAMITSAPRLFCPAMNDAMWQSPVTQRNVQTLEGLGFERFGPVVGHLAEGYEGAGRMHEPEEILARIGELCSGS